MKILIVDDDRMICAGTVRRIVNMRFPEIEAVEAAYSGEEALEMIRRQPFDAMFTDIRMAEIDGLRLIREARELNPYMICVVITAFDRFQYAQQALRLGVEDFLVKPMSEQSMRIHVRAVIDKHASRMQDKASRLELEICAQMLSGERSVAECFEHNGFAPPEGDVAMVVWHEDSAAPAAALDGLWLWRPKKRKFLLVGGQGDAARQKIASAIHRSGVYAGVSAPGRNLKQLTEQAGQALNFTWLQTEPGASFWSPQDLRGLSALRARVLAEVRALNADGVRVLLDNSLQYLDASRRAFARALIESVFSELTEVRASMGMEAGAPHAFPPGEGLSAAIRAAAAEIRAVQEMSANPNRLHPVAYAKRYVQNHLYEPIDMTALANRLNLSYAYFSRIFREQAGVTFTKYLVTLRMREVCRLLLAGEKVVDIAEKLSYHSAANLTRSFTREFGMSPSRWLELRAGETVAEED